MEIELLLNAKCRIHDQTIEHIALQRAFDVNQNFEALEQISRRSETRLTVEKGKRNEEKCENLKIW